MNSVRYALGLSLVSITLSAQTAPTAFTAKDRLLWIVNGTVGPRSLATGIVSSGYSTWTNTPVEYGPHWEGFAKRYGIRLTGIATDRTIEAGVGAFIGEDPRYRVLGDGQPFKSRLGHVLKWAFIAGNTDGSIRPAYARYVSWGGGSFLSGTWRPDSDATVKAGVERVYLGVLLRMSTNAVSEFLPDIRRKRKPAGPAPGTP